MFEWIRIVNSTPFIFLRFFGHFATYEYFMNIRFLKILREKLLKISLIITLHTFTFMVSNLINMSNFKVKFHINMQNSWSARY